MHNNVFMSAAGGPLPMSRSFLNFVPVSGTKTRFETAAAINTGRCAQGGKMGSGDRNGFQFITSVLPDRLKEKIHLARARWSSLVDKSYRATSLQVVDIPQVNHSPPEQVCNA